jgi:phenylacetate-CoA ligase
MDSSFRKVYDNAPVLVQNLLVTTKGLEFRLRRSKDAIIRGYLAKLLTSEGIPHDERRERTNQALRRHLQEAVETTPYYRNLARNREFPEIWETDDPLLHFSEIPLLEKARVRGNENDFYSERFHSLQLLNGSTSGTTGSPIVTRETRDSNSKRFAFVARLRTWAGLKDVVHPRRAQFTGRDICQETKPFWRHNYVDHALLFSTVHIGERSVSEYLGALSRFQAELIDGYPSALLAIARISVLQNSRVPQPKAIIVSAETLTSEMREEISRAFNAPVFNQYAATEPSCFWSDCEFGSMHVHEEYGISEILDPTGTQVGPGQIGEVVVTSLINSAMPLIRYRTGDLAQRGPDELCDCGRTLVRVGEVIGRSDDILYFPGRGYIGRLDPIFKGIVGLVEAQVVQESLQFVRVLVVVDPERWNAEQSQKLLSNLASKVGLKTHLEIQRVEAIPRGPNGKFRSVISRCMHQYPIETRPY